MLYHKCSDLSNRPSMISHARFHRRRHAQGLVDADEVVVHMKQRQHSDVIFEFLTKGISQPSEPAHVHPHVEILSFNVRRADVLRVGRTNDRLSFGAKTLRRAVTGCPFRIAAEYLNQLGVAMSFAKASGTAVKYIL
jgi:hypothetical protein